MEQLPELLDFFSHKMIQRSKWVSHNYSLAVLPITWILPSVSSCKPKFNFQEMINIWHVNIKRFWGKADLAIKVFHRCWILILIFFGVKMIWGGKYRSGPVNVNLKWGISIHTASADSATQTFTTWKFQCHLKGKRQDKIFKVRMKILWLQPDIWLGSGQCACWSRWKEGPSNRGEDKEDQAYNNCRCF